MVVIANLSSFYEAAADLIPRGFFQNSKYYLTKGRSYEVFAISFFDAGVYFQIVNDLDIISWLPGQLFIIDDRMMPDDWQINIFTRENIVVIGPKFLSESVESYQEMVELNPESVKRFWERVNSQRSKL